MTKALSLLATLVSLLAVLLAAGDQSFRRVDAGGHWVRMLVTGRGTPAVVFEAGAGGPLEAWVRVQPEVSRFTTTVSYDRAGNGVSPRGPTPRDGQHVARELHTALHHAGVPPPYILVGHSLGGPFIRVFAGIFPDEVAGMVLVDPTQEELIAWAKARQPKTVGQEPRPYDEVDCAPATFAQAQESPVPPGIPVVLISGMGPTKPPGFLTEQQRKETADDLKVLYPVKLKFYREWLERIPNGRLMITEKSGHGIPLEEPGLVVGAIQGMVSKARLTPAKIRNSKLAL